MNPGRHCDSSSSQLTCDVTSTDTRYVDVSKLGDERISGLKEKLGELVDDVNLNRPSVLILDGLDSLASVDLPVRLVLFSPSLS